MLEVMESGTIIVPVGSRVTCSPPPTDTDEDYLLLVADMDDAVSRLIDVGFSTNMTPDQERDYIELQRATNSRFRSVRLGDLNYIVTESAFFFDRFLTATHICKTMNVMDKQHRILIFHGVFGDSYLNKTAGITDDLVEKIHDDLESSTFGEDMESSAFEEHVAIKIGDGTHALNAYLGRLCTSNQVAAGSDVGPSPAKLLRKTSDDVDPQD